MKIARIAESLIFLIFLFLFHICSGQVHAIGQQGCCSWHGGVAGCECCDGTKLSETCTDPDAECKGSGYSSGNASVEGQEVKSQSIIESEQLPYGSPSKEHVLYRQAYAASFNDKFLVPNWVCYTLKEENINYSTERKGDFCADPNLPVGKRAENSDYDKSGYAKGHMAPADDMRMSPKTMCESFYLSNACPQVPKFNGVIWRSLEDAVRDWVSARKELYICTGPIFYDRNKDGVVDEKDPQRIGDVAVPDAFYKIVYSPSEKKAIAFIFKNKEYPPGASLLSYINTVGEIDRQTNLNFFSKLDPQIKERFYESPEVELWE